MNHGSLFSGIGGFDLAAQRMNWNNVFHCEINPFGRKILNYYWPDAESFTDITQTDFTKYNGAIDIISGGFPCQPFSVAGKRKGTEDHRNLWPEMLRAIQQIQPRWIVGENVPGLINWSDGLVFEQVQADLENEGYQVWPVILPACAKNAPHKRERVWFVSYNNKRNWSKIRFQTGRQVNFYSHEKSGITTYPGFIRPEERQIEPVGIDKLSKEWSFANTQHHGQHGAKNGKSTGKRNDSNKARQEAISQFTGCNSLSIDANMPNIGLQGSIKEYGEQRQKCNDKFINGYGGKWFDAWEQFPTQSPVCSRNDGFSAGLDNITFSKWRNESIKAYGNAVVPQVVYQIFKAIQQFENLQHEQIQ
jgi:DNA (cytosine-5)-methyltransferase 1